MPKSKEMISDSDSASEDNSKSKKRAKKSTEKASSKKAKIDSDETSWDLGGNKHVTVRPFKGKWYVDIREMYTDKNGEQKPTKKGVFMNLDTWKQLTKVTDEVNEVNECLVHSAFI
ncbi:hypothetical protein QAD02_013238 [Eretmocerus hayati]|uniref:Uncharacterized protein n=1 Tax=Eretmocerus hayati TaxID=131215 RepID=A0ACC2P200_9HYME|nr:hypothetical protein QAD02_013238 [Eretmocerus hayati]